MLGNEVELASTQTGGGRQAMKLDHLLNTKRYRSQPASELAHRLK